MDILSKAFEKFFSFKLETPLHTSGTIQKDELNIKYILTEDASEKTVLDLFIFEMEGFRPVHKRINARGEILELENFQFSIMYEFPEERREEELKMKAVNRDIAAILIKKGLAEKRERWIQKYL